MNSGLVNRLGIDIGLEELVSIQCCHQLRCETFYMNSAILLLEYLLVLFNHYTWIFPAIFIYCICWRLTTKWTASSVNRVLGFRLKLIFETCGEDSLPFYVKFHEKFSCWSSKESSWICNNVQVNFKMFLFV